MKNLLLFALIITSSTFIGCNQSNEFPYRYAHAERVPDSLRDEMANFITETMRACDQHLTTSDYEDVDDVVSEVRYTAFKIYTASVAGLQYNNPDDSYAESWIFIPFNELTDRQKVIFDSIKANQQ